MINVIRTDAVPASLNTSAIREYRQTCQQYALDQQRPLEEQTLPKPDCGSAYRTEEVTDALNGVFLGKCYLTEEEFGSTNKMEIDHFLPRHERPDLKYEWTNLYAATRHANGSRPRITPAGGYLDPCHPDDDVEREILYALSILDDKAHFKARDEGNIRATNTAQLLVYLHKDIQKAIQNKHNGILRRMAEWGTAQKQNDWQRVFELELELKELLSRKSSFTMLMRSSRIIRRLPAEFFD